MLVLQTRSLRSKPNCLLLHSGRTEISEVSLFIESPPCYSLKTENVAMRENTFAARSLLPLVNQLNGLQVVSNVAVDQAKRALFASPSMSTTAIDSMEAENNRRDLISVSNGSVAITNSSFVRNKCGGRQMKPASPYRTLCSTPTTARVPIQW